MKILYFGTFLNAKKKHGVQWCYFLICFFVRTALISATSIWNIIIYLQMFKKYSQ